MRLATPLPVGLSIRCSPGEYSPAAKSGVYSFKILLDISISSDLTFFFFARLVLNPGTIANAPVPVTISSMLLVLSLLSSFFITGRSGSFIVEVLTLDFDFSASKSWCLGVLPDILVIVSSLGLSADVT